MRKRKLTYVQQSRLSERALNTQGLNLKGELDVSNQSLKICLGSKEAWFQLLHQVEHCQKRFDVCLSEKLSILLENKANSINKHSELMQKCSHSNKYKLSNVGGKNALNE